MTPVKRGQRLYRLALVTFLLTLLVVGASAWLRLSVAGLGCADWPACYGRGLAGVTHTPWEGARLVHRVVATLALLAGILLCWQAWRPWPLRPAARYAGLLLALMLFLSVVGMGSSDPRAVLVNLINLLGGLGLVSFSWRVAITALPELALPRRPGPLFRAAFSTLTATILLGALIGARYAAPACVSLVNCQGVWWPEDGWAALQPFATLVGPALTGDAGGITLHLLHRYCAILATLLLGALAWQAWPYPEVRPAALAVLATLSLETVLGMLTVASGFGLWLAVTHNMGAALLLAAAASLMRRAA